MTERVERRGRKPWQRPVLRSSAQDKRTMKWDEELPSSDGVSVSRRKGLKKRTKSVKSWQSLHAAAHGCVRAQGLLLWKLLNDQAMIWGTHAHDLRAPPHAPTEWGLRFSRTLVTWGWPDWSVHGVIKGQRGELVQSESTVKQITKMWQAFVGQGLGTNSSILVAISQGFCLLRSNL